MNTPEKNRVRKRIKKPARKSFFVKFLALIIFIGLIFGGGYTAYYLKVPEAFWEKLLPLPQGEKVGILIEQGMNASQAARAFELGGALEGSSPSELVKWLIKFGLDKKIRAGYYSVIPSSAWNLARQLRFVKPALIKATIIPGFDIFSLEENLTAQDFDTKTLEQILADDLIFPSKTSEIFNSIQADVTTRIAFLEPETYMLVERDLKELIKNSASAWDKHWSEVIASHNLTMNDIREAAIIASMVEREVLFDDECRRVAGVIHNRLRSRMPLQIDATVVYAWKLQGRKVTRVLNKDLEINSPYNTYRVAGLPPSPICIPGAAAWDAALNPEFNDYYYYVASKDGHHYFAKTYSEHLNNIKQIRSGK